MSLAGDVAQRKFAPRSRDGNRDDDLHRALNLLDYISRNNEVVIVRLTVATIEAPDLVNTHWDDISAVAAGPYGKQNSDTETGKRRNQESVGRTLRTFPLRRFCRPVWWLYSVIASVVRQTD